MAPPNTNKPPGPDDFRHPRYDKLKVAAINTIYEFVTPAFQAFIDALVLRADDADSETQPSESTES